MTPAYLAIDWGTTNRRAHAVAADGTVVASVADERGVLAIPPGGFPDALARLRATLGDLPAIAAGMIGSTRGWHHAPYCPAPVDAAALAAALTPLPGHRCALVPGVSLMAGTDPASARADVMRGEEVQVLGAVAAGLAPPDALVCQPGTHNKWVRVAGGRIVDFATAMTGELFALIRGGGILAGMLDDPVVAGPAFRRGLARGRGATDLPVALFGVRAAVLLGTLPPADAAAFASGILIGADVGTQVAGRAVHLLAAGPLADLYAAAIADAGGHAIPVDAGAAFLTGIHQLWTLTR